MSTDYIDNIMLNGEIDDLKTQKKNKIKWEIVCTQTRDVTSFCAVSDSLVRKFELCLVTT